MEQICWLSSIMRISSILTRDVVSARSGIFGVHYTAAATRRQLIAPYGIIARRAQSETGTCENHNNDHAPVIFRTTRMLIRVRVARLYGANTTWPGSSFPHPSLTLVSISCGIIALKEMCLEDNDGTQNEIYDADRIDWHITHWHYRRRSGWRGDSLLSDARPASCGDSITAGRQTRLEPGAAGPADGRSRPDHGPGAINCAAAHQRR